MPADPDPTRALLDRLEANAEKATPGPWYQVDDGGSVSADGYDIGAGGPDAMDGPHIAYMEPLDEGRDNARYLAALDPATLLALVAVARAAEALRAAQGALVFARIADDDNP